ncbi:hypothetical protein [Thermococcus sp.]|uniref:hypothetical protein n=1 Tax=Thermococcus sp. TaxID=35749 RepID=UPI002639BFF8|nr:hypothetical protein [Thermococcus sp.]
MVDLDLFSEPDEVEELLRQLEDVSRLSPQEVFSYLIELSEATLSLYIVMRDSLPRSYGRVKFSRFVEKKRKQVENMRHIARELYPGLKTKEVKFSKRFKVETVGDYIKVLRNAINLESISLRAFRYLSESSSEGMLLSDLADEIEGNISELKKELEKAESFERKARFSEFVKELVGGEDGRG